MSSIALSFVVVVDLAGVFFNIRMLLNCLKRTTNHSSLKPFIICQFVYQVTILATTAVEAWRGLEAQHEERCSILRMLSISITLLHGCNLTAVFFISSSVASRQLTPKLIASAALCMGLILSAVFWWNSCFLRESVVCWPVLIVIILVIFLLLMLLQSAKYTWFNEDNENPKACSLRDLVTKRKTVTFTLAWSLLCLAVMIASLALPRKTLKELGRRNDFHLGAIIVNSIQVGIVLPLTCTNLFFLINSISAEEENEMNEFKIRDTRVKVTFC